MADMNRRPIAIFDSGIGGLPYLKALRARLPEESYVYVADNEGFPYGRKTRAEVERLVRDRMDRIVERFSPKLVVIACNTASQAALEAVRRAHAEIDFVGTVPAVKPAARSTRTGAIAVLATDRAAVDPYLDELIRRYAPGVRVLRVGAQALVEFVEERLMDADEAERLSACESAIRPLRGSGVDRIVLACTHFLHVVSYISAAAGPQVRIVDSRDGVARRARALVTANRGIAAASSPGGSLYATGETERWGGLRRFAAQFGLAFEGAL